MRLSLPRGGVASEALEITHELAGAMHKTRLKGGSLSGTYLCRPDVGQPFVRKDVSLVHNREYGFQRWYSQLKRMQRYAELFPGVFPALHTYGMLHDPQQGDMAYFDMEYIEGAVTVQEFLMQTSDRARIDRMFVALQAVMTRMHSTQLPSTAAPMELYIYEEIEQKIGACMGDARFAQLYRLPELEFNGVNVASIGTVMGEYKSLATKTYRHTSETFTHGNLTLENILYVPAENRIVFIDPYEENIIDSVLAEYSQVLQSCNSKYELYNSAKAQVDGHRVTCAIADAPGLDYFNVIFHDFMAERLDADALVSVRLLEISQFMRMLPFKLAIDPDKMLFFYALGSYLFEVLRHGPARASKA